EELKLAIEEYIDYYNNKRIKVKLKGLTPASYRSQSLLINN
ncbi:IS3 family transposase, partial [Fusobacterium sp.]